MGRRFYCFEVVVQMHNIELKLEINEWNGFASIVVCHIPSKQLPIVDVQQNYQVRESWLRTDMSLNMNGSKWILLLIPMFLFLC